MPSGERTFRIGQRNRENFLEAFEKCGSVNEACVIIDVQPNTYRRWRTNYPRFASKVDAVKRDFALEGHMTHLQGGDAFSMDEWHKKEFYVFRKHYFKMDTPDFQLELVNSYEHTPPGQITMILLPPEHGKTTLFEDYASWKLALEPSYRFTVGSESQGMARKILSRVKLRMDPDGPFPRYVNEWGPFIPQTKGRRKNTGNADSAIRQPWGADFFNVYRKSDHDERDFSMVALGIGSQVAGTRTDHLHLDDVQSLNNISSAAKDAQKIRQDWFSRPGQRGRTTINGTKVEIGDIYEILEEELSSRVLNIIRLPAIIDRGNGPEPLWPYDEKSQTGWTMEMLDRQREIVGEDAWNRNYMQKPVAKGDSTFTEESVGRCLNPLRSMLHDADPEDGPIVIGVDPSIGGTSAFAVTQFSDKKFILLESRVERGLTTNSQIFRVVEELILRWAARGCVCSDVIIETMAFQKGLIEDEELIRLRDAYGFRPRGHLTGRNKYDENIGLASMATSFMKSEVDIPYADDTKTRYNSDDFKRECLAWRPRVSGAKLRQDRLMAFWFCWIEWRKRRRVGIMDRSTPHIKAEGLGYEPTVGNLFGTGGKYDAA